MDAAYRETLAIARAELEKLADQESELERLLHANRTRQVGLRKTIDSLSALVGEDSQDGPVTGISDAIRTVLEDHSATGRTFLTAVGIRERLVKAGFSLDSYKNPMAVIHTTLKRLQDQGEVQMFEGNGKKIGYRRSTPDTGAITDGRP